MAVIQHKVEMGGDVITTYVRNGTIRDYNDKFASSFVFEVPKSVTASHTPAIYDQVEAWR
jgi:hypothetical protein